jgi:site-specific DNA-methyltransferase (adenine-specific)
MAAYLTFMTARLNELHRVLRETGSLYLHCDPSASHYLKVVLDTIFEAKGFQSEIIWRRTGSHNKATRWAPIHDAILYYTKSPLSTWNAPRRPHMIEHVRRHFVADGNDGFKTHYYGNVLTGSGRRAGESGAPWHGFDPSLKDRHWAIPSKIWEEVEIDPTGLTQHQKLDLLHELGLITIGPDATWPIYTRSVNPDAGPPTSDLWAFQPYTEGTVWGSPEGIDAEVSWLKPGDGERLGYPTQKPLGLLRRIILASSHEGDCVLDPFCGCGTTLHAAELLNRRWIGIDESEAAIELCERRLRDAFDGKCVFVRDTDS